MHTFCPGDEFLGPLCDALPRNTRLRTLNISHNSMTREFAAQRLLPAVRANTTLQHLKVGYFRDETHPALEAAAALVASRR